jgi:PD-(D/E)XK endonuclease
MRKDRGIPHRRIPASEDIPVRKPNRQRGLAARLHGDLGEVAFLHNLHKATELGFMVAQPYGAGYPFDFIVQGGPSLLRVQVKAAAHMRFGLYGVSIFRHLGPRRLADGQCDVDFVAVYIIPEKTWYILPVREVENRQTLMFRPKGYRRRNPYAHYREAWHLLREADGLVFG